MESVQYEELCRFALAQELGIPIDQVRSVHLPGATLPELEEYRHQIDLYWVVDGPVRYVNIANAKWRGSRKIEQGNLLQLQKVREDTNAHKAVMMTNFGFTKGARGVAEKYGIALHLVNPTATLPVAAMPLKDRDAIRAVLVGTAQAGSDAVYTYCIEHRAFTPERARPPESATRRPAVVTPPANRMLSPSGETRGGYHTKGPPGGPEHRTK